MRPWPTRSSLRRHLAPVLAPTLALGPFACRLDASVELETPSVDAGLEGSANVDGDLRASVRIVREGDKLTYPDAEIEFETASAELRSDTTEVIDTMAAVLRRYPGLHLRVEGHTDSRGSDRANKALSDRRALAIKAALVDRGIVEARLSTASFGEDRPERPEPPYCHNRAESRVPEDKIDECLAIWADNRRAAFVVVEGGEELPAAGEIVGPQASTTVAKATPTPTRRPDWALRLFTGYSTAILNGADHHGGHLGLGLHASQRFGANHRGYIGGGPRLHYRGLRGRESGYVGDYELSVHQLGPEGNLLVGGGSERVVALFSLRAGLGVSVLRGSEEGGAKSLDDTTLGGWLLGGLTVFGKVAPRWSVGGHAEFGALGVPGVGFGGEVGVNVAWHFGIGRRYRLKI